MTKAVFSVALCLLTCIGLVQAAEGWSLPFDSRQVAERVRGSRLSADGRESSPLTGEFLIDTTGVQREEVPAVAFDGTNYFVVWQDYRNGSESDIYGARVSPAGTSLDPAGIPISTAANSQFFPAVSFDGTNFLVVWSDYRNQWRIYGTRVSQAGAVLDTAGIPISVASYGESYPAACFDGTNYLVVWQSFRNNVVNSIYGARVSPAGTVLDEFPVSNTPQWELSPSVAFDGTNYLVVWDDNTGSGTYDIYGARVSQAGTVLDPLRITISTAAYDQVAPEVSFDGANFLVVWRDDRSHTSRDIYGARVSKTGTVMDAAGIPISIEGHHQQDPAVAFDGANSLVVWRDERLYPSAVYGTRVSPAGTLLDEFAAVTEGGFHNNPAICCKSESNMLLVYSGYAGEVQGKVYGVYRIWGKIGPFPGIEEGEAIRFAQDDNRTTIVRGVLNMGQRLTANGSPSDNGLYDTNGRKVADLKPGPNDIRHLGSGVYFVYAAEGASHIAQKVVVQK